MTEPSECLLLLQSLKQSAFVRGAYNATTTLPESEATTVTSCRGRSAVFHGAAHAGTRTSSPSAVPSITT